MRLIEVAKKGKATRIERAKSKALLAAGIGASAATAASATGNPAIIALAGGVGVLTGLIVGDEQITFQVDYVAVPAFEYSMVRNGVAPSHSIYIKAGETLLPTGGNVDDVDLGVAEAAALTKPVKRKKQRKSKWNTFVSSEWDAYQKAYPNGKKTFGAISKAASRKYKKGDK
jgi:hypothetical protein